MAERIMPHSDPSGGAAGATGRPLRLMVAPWARRLAPDLIAGLTVAAVALPQSMAYALIARVPPVVGLYTAIVTAGLASLLNSSAHLVSGPTNAISVLTASALAVVAVAHPYYPPEVVVVLTIMVGAMQIIVWLLRVGDLTRYVSTAVIIGFMAGAGAMVAIEQVKNLLGLRPPPSVAKEHPLVQVALTLRQGGPVNPWAVAIGLGTIVTVVLIRRIASRRQWLIPDLLIAVVLSALVVWVLRLDQGVVDVIPDVPRRLPRLSLPPLGWPLISQLTGGALAITFLGLLEALSVAKSLAVQSRQRLDTQREILAEAVSNLAGGLFGCMPGAGSLTRSAINYQAGAISRWSGVMAALAVAAGMLLLAPLAHYIPTASLAGILMVTAWRMIDRPRLMYCLRATRFDAITASVTALAAIGNLEMSIFIGVFIQFLFYIPRAARIRVTELIMTPERVIRERTRRDKLCPRIAIYSIEGELFFGAAESLEHQLGRMSRHRTPEQRVIILRLKRARNIDMSCLELLDDSIAAWQWAGVRVLLCGVRDDLEDPIRNVGLDQRLPPGSIFPERRERWSSTIEAVRHAYTILGPDVCAGCPRRQGGSTDQTDWYYMI